MELPNWIRPVDDTVQGWVFEFPGSTKDRKMFNQLSVSF